MKLHYLLFAALFAAVGCSKTDLQAPETPGKSTEKIVLKASAGEQSKVGFEDEGTGLKVTWVADDTFSLYNADGTWAADFKLTSGEGTKDGEFTMVDGGTITDQQTYTVVYPRTGAGTLAQYQVDLRIQSHDGTDPLASIGNLCYMRKDDYVYNKNTPISISFEHKNAMMTLKLSKPDVYNSTGDPTKLVLRNGNKSYSVSLNNETWDAPITAYVMIDPTDAAGQDIVVDIYTDNYLYTAKITATNQHQAGMRYTATFVGNSFTEVTMYTLATANTIPAGTTNIIISDAITSATSSSDFNALKTYMSTVSSNNVVLSMPNATAIPEIAFSACTTLEEINLPMVTEIGGSAFSFNYSPACTALKTVNAPNLAVIGDQVFSGCTALTSIDLSKVTSLGESAFSGCKELTTVDLSQISTIGAVVFSGCSKLENVTLNPALNTLTIGMFGDCTSLKSLDFSNITSIGYATFNGCSNLVITELPKVQTIGDQAFIGCTSLLTLDMPEVLTLGETVFGFSGTPDNCCTSLTSVNMPKVTSMGSETFFGCTSLETVTLGASLTTLPADAFRNCTSLKNIDLSKVTSIGSRTFNGAVALDVVDLPEVVSIGESAFTGVKLKSLVAPKVTSIGKGAFGLAGSETVATIELATGIADNITAAVNTFDNTLTSNIDLKLGIGVTGADPDTATWTPSGDNQTYTFKSIIQ